MRKNIIRTVLICTSFIFITSSVSALTCTNLTRTLSKYSENSEVLALQQFLFESGYLTAKPNGYFGENTRKALIAFQKNQKINGTGNVGPLTRVKIKEISCSGATTSTEKKNPSESVQVKKEEKVTVVVKDTPVTVPTQTVPVVVPTNEIPTIFVKTRIPTEVTSTSATLSGSGGIDGEKHWFEWGKTIEMGNATPQTVASTSYTYKLTGLSPNTTYVFRAVTSVASSTERRGETAYGDILYFTTPPSPVAAAPAPTVSITSTGIAVNSSGSAKVVWSSTNATTCFFTGGGDDGDWTKQRSLSGSYITRPITVATVFGIGCRNNAGYTVTGSVTVPKIVN